MQPELITRRIEELLTDKFANTDCFLVDIAISGTKIQVAIDRDTSLDIDTCAEVSRYLEKYLEAEQLVADKYTLEVSSPGMTNPFKVFRQYAKNLGRKVEIKLNSGTKIEGVLRNVNTEYIEIEQQIPSANKKNKETDLALTAIPLTDIKTTKKVVTFK